MEEQITSHSVSGHVQNILFLFYERKILIKQILEILTLSQLKLCNDIIVPRWQYSKNLCKEYVG